MWEEAGVAWINQRVLSHTATIDQGDRARVAAVPSECIVRCASWTPQTFTDDHSLLNWTSLYFSDLSFGTYSLTKETKAHWFNGIYFKKRLELSFNFLILFDCHFKSHPLNEDWYVVGLLIIFPDEEIVACVLMKTMSPWLISTIIEWVELWSSPTVWLSERAPPFLSEFTISSVKMSPLKLL